MDRRKLLALLVPLSTSGCLQLVGNEDEEETDEGEDRHADGADEGDGSGEDGATDDSEEAGDAESEQGTDDDSDEDESPDYPLGLSEDSVSSLLADNHVRNLEDAAFEYRYVNGVHGHDQTARVADGTAIEKNHASEHFYRDGLAEELWTALSGGDRYYGIAQWGARTRTATDIASLVDSERVRGTLQSISFDEVVPEDRDGETVFRISGDTIEDPGPIEEEWYLEELRDVSVEGVVLENGIVESLHLEFVHVLDETERLAEGRYEILDVGNTTVQEPDWVASAEEEAPELSLTLSDDGTYLRLEHDGGQTLPPNTVVEKTDDTEYETIGRGFGEGDVLYVWFEDGEAHLSHDSPPSDAPEQPDSIVEVHQAGPYLSWRIRNL